MQEPLRTLRMGSQDHTDRRRAPRTPSTASATLAVAGGERCDATLTDVSLYGCCVDAVADWLRPGRFVAIGLAGSKPIEAVVRWARDGAAGMELLHPLSADRQDWHALID